MITVLTWFWTQPEGRTRYTAANVNIWADMVRRNISMPHRIACVTDLTDGLDPRIEIIPPPRDFEEARIPTWGPQRPQCLRRLAMFRKDAGELFGERFVCMDLDCVIGAALDPLLEDDADFRIFRGTAAKRPYNGSMMLLRAGARTQVYDRFTIAGATEAGRKFIGSDQAWISHVLGPNEKTFGPEHGAYWWDRGKTQEPVRVMFFPGDVKPWDLIEQGKHQFVMQHYRRDRDGRCIILGLGKTVWQDAENAMDAGPVDGAIALVDVAAQWPGKLLAVARGYGPAERLARMHGFNDILFCGREVKELA